MPHKKRCFKRRHKMRNLNSVGVTLFLISVVSLCAVSVFAQEEELTVTTYYPAPYGEYEELTVNTDLDASTASVSTSDLNVIGTAAIPNISGDISVTGSISAGSDMTVGNNVVVTGDIGASAITIDGNAVIDTNAAGHMIFTDTVSGGPHTLASLLGGGAGGDFAIPVYNPSTGDLHFEHPAGTRIAGPWHIAGDDGADGDDGAANAPYPHHDSDNNELYFTLGPTGREILRVPLGGGDDKEERGTISFVLRSSSGAWQTQRAHTLSSGSWASHGIVSIRSGSGIQIGAIAETYTSGRSLYVRCKNADPIPGSLYTGTVYVTWKGTRR
jgi:hypothetical protein